MGQSEFIYVMQSILVPFSDMLSYVIAIIGLCLILTALHRVRHHSHGQGSKHHSGMATFFFFFSGATIMNYSGFAQIMCTALLGKFTDTGTNPMTVQYYINLVNTSDSASQQLEYFVFSVLLVIGLLAFVRGLVLLVKLGEGHTEGTLPKAMTHILGGAIGVNASALYQIFINFNNGFHSISS